VLILPPLLARWTSWRRISLLCTSIYVIYFITAFIFVTAFSAAGWPIAFPAIGTAAKALLRPRSARIPIYDSSPSLSHSRLSSSQRRESAPPCR